MLGGYLLTFVLAFVFGDYANTSIVFSIDLDNLYKNFISGSDGGDPPIDLRRPISAWQVTMKDGTRFYVDAASGQIVATRTRWWRFYDFMWGLHIMDPGTREDTHNPWVIGFGLIALALSVLGTIILPLTIKRKRGRLTLD